MLPTLRPYQTDARYQLNTLLNAGIDSILCIPTGTGKTKVATVVISDRIALGKRVYVIVPSLEVFWQFIVELQTAGLNPGYINDEGVRGRDRMVYVCMPLSMRNLLNMIPESIYPDEIAIDEVHHDGADTWVHICEFFARNGKQLPKLGMSATPVRSDNRPLPGYREIVQTITMKEAIEKGYLAKPLVIVPDELYQRIDIPTEDLDTDKGLEKQAAALGDPVIVGNMLDTYRRIFGGLPVLVACPTFKDAAECTEMFRKDGWKWDHIHGELSKGERQRMVRGIKNGTINGLCTVGVGIEGWDLPGLYGLIWRRRTNSIRIYLQFIGRVLRPLPGKQYGIIVDATGNLFLHGFPEAPRVWTLDGDAPDRPADHDTPTMRICPRCGVANAAANMSCHMCGLDFSSEEAHNIRERHLPAMIDGKLVAITSDGMEAELSAVRDATKEEVAEEAVGNQHGTPLSKLERIDFLQKGLFAGARSELMREALEEWRR